MAKIRVGTSGWSYDHWMRVFYPEDLPPSGRLEFYATRFPTVEINATFYRMPSEDMVERWASQVPPGFAFAVKGSRFITHYRRLAETDAGVRSFGERMSLLGDALDVVLWQLPPNLTRDDDLLQRFLDGLPGKVRHAVEFRNVSWLTQGVFDILRSHNVAHVHVSSDEMPENTTVTADFVYLRFHGTAAYHGAYSEPALEPWRRFLLEQARYGREGYVFFNNDAEGHAPRDAERLTSMLGDVAFRLPSVEAATAGRR